MAMMSPMAGMSGGPQDLMKEAMDRKRAQVAQGQGQTPKPTSTSQINQQGSTPSQPAPQAAPPQQQTFAQMAAAGQARPAPPTPAPAQAQPPAWAPATGSTGNLREVMAQALGNPTGYGQADVQQFYNTAAEGIDDEFTQKERALREELARSGLDESSIMAGRTYDLNVGKRSAMADLANKYGENYAKEFAAARQAAINSGVDLEKADQDNALGIGKLGLDTELGRGELDVKRQQAATDSSKVANDATYNMGRLAVDQGDLAFRRDDAAAERARRAAEFDKTYGLDLTKEERARQEFEKNYGLDERRMTQQEKDAEWQKYQDLLGFEGDTQTPWDDPNAETVDPMYDPLSDLYYGQEPLYG